MIQEVLTPLLERVEELAQLIDESPYLPAEMRKNLEGELSKISEKLKEGNITFASGEKMLGDLNKKAAQEEIESLIQKIGHLNPSSPRLQTLRECASKLNHGEISSEQAREEILKLMKG